MNMEHLHTFLVVCSCSNFSEAAKILFIPQPTVSNRIQFLEETLGQKLFIRGKRGVTLTEAGETFLPYAQKVVDTMSTAMSLLNTTTQENKLKLGSTIPFTYPLILKKIKELSAKYPDLKISLLNVDHKYIMDNLSSRDIDTAFVVEPIVQKGIECHLIGQEELQLILSPEHELASREGPIQLEDLENENLVCYEPYYETINTLFLRNTTGKSNLISNQIGLIKQLVTQGGGVTILPPLSAKPEIVRGELVNIPLKSDKLIIRYYLVCRQNERYYEEILLKDMTSEIASPANKI